MKNKLSKRKVRGQITIMAALSFTIVITLVTTCINSAYNIMYKTQIKQACMLSAETIFTDYMKDMLKEYGIFTLKKSDTINQRLTTCINENISPFSKEISLIDAGISNCVYFTDDGGTGIRKEILSYMKYGKYSVVAENILNSERQVRKAQAVSDITDGIIECEESLYKMDAAVLSLVSTVEGLKITESGFEIEKNGPVAADDYYVKSLINGAVSKESVNISNDKVYNAMKDATYGYVNVNGLLNDMISNIDDLIVVGDEESESYGNMSYKAIYNRSYETVVNEVVNSRDKIVKAINIIHDFDNAKSCAESKVDECEELLYVNSEYLDKDIYDGFNEDISEIRNNGLSSKTMMCDIDLIEKELNFDRNILNEAINVLYGFNTDLNTAVASQEKDKVIKCRDILLKFSNYDLKFDYSKVDFSYKSGSIEIFNQLRDVLENGICGLVTDGKVISQKEINSSNHATAFYNNQEATYSYNAYDEALYNEYLLDKFYSYTDYLDEKVSNDNKQLDYVLELIIGGKSNDRDNLNCVIMEISAIREGMNLAYLLTDSAKKNEAYTLAASVLGFTGSNAVIKAGQYLILAVWAYGEAIMDIKRLLKGEKVEFVKSSKSWELSLKNLLAMKFESSSGESKSGIDYEDYLRMLLLTKDRIKKNYNTMCAMELRMMELGHTDFRMSDYIFSMKGAARFKIGKSNNYYVQTINFSYL